MNKAAAWRREVENEFSWLIPMGFTYLASADSFWETSCTWSADGIAIKVARSTEFQRVEVHLIRLVAGEVPAYPIWVTSDDRNWALADGLLKVRSSDWSARIPAAGLGSTEVRAQLAFWSSALEAVAPDFLAGEPGAIDDVAEMVLQQVAEHPQVLTISVPEDASQESVDTTVANASRDLPHEVQVVVRRYRRPQ